MTASEIESHVHAWIVQNTLKGGELTRESSLIAEGWLDSLQIVQLVEFLERSLEVAIDLDEMVPENFETVPRVAALVGRSPRRPA